MRFKEELHFFLNNKGNKMYFVVFLTIAALSFTIPFHRKILPYLIAFLTFIFIFFPSLSIKINQIKKQWKPLLMFVALFIMYIIATIYSENLHVARLDLLLKIPLLLFPLIFATFSKSYSKRHSDRILDLFVLACFLSSLFLSIRALILYIVKQDAGYFFYEGFSLFFHPGYFGMYVNFAMAVVLFKILKNGHTFSKKKTILSTLLVFYFLVIILLINSKAIFISTALILLYWVLRMIFVNKNYRLGMAFAFFTALLIALSIKFYPQTYNRLMIAMKNVNPSREHTNRYDGSYMRLQIWESSVALIKDNFWTGVGTGDVKDELIKAYKKRDLNLIVERNLNAHNQFLQTFIATGLLGFLSLLLLTLLPLYKNYKTEAHLLVSFYTIIIITSLLVESILETQAGVVFFSFFGAFFVFFNPNTKNE